MKTLLGFAIPFLPLWNSFKSSDRRFYVFIEQPITGILVTFTSLYIAEVLTSTRNFDSFFRNFIEIYLSFQLANIIRDGVNTDSAISAKKKVFLNWYYSAISYILFTAADRIAKARTESEVSFAYGIVVFSLIWPIFSQAASTYLWTPILFSKFPRRSLLIKLSDISISHSELLKDEKYVWNTRWINWFRKSKNLKLKTLQYWAAKTAIGVGIGVVMTTLYYLARWELVGRSVSESKLLVSLLSLILPYLQFF